MSLRWLLLALFFGYGTTVPTEQKPLSLSSQEKESLQIIESTSRGQALQGRFLHITDFHPDQFYEYYSSTEAAAACHRGDGPAGIFGAETTDCDSPISLINATFQWIDDHIRGSVDFVLWTGDSARHDSDDSIPRTEKEVVELNELMVGKFVEVFGKQGSINDNGPTNDLTIPIIPNFGNNDIMPHNILEPGPNRWTRKYATIWKQFIPEERRHGFEKGGWFSVEVIPNKLAVFSLNTLYFFDSNTAVDGCDDSSEPGFEQMDWLRVQLQSLRQRGMKAIIMGHVPPARTESKQSWDESCWQKYTLWMRQYRDVMVGSVYGHMNIDHFMLQDFEDIRHTASSRAESASSRMALDDELTIQSSAEYLTELRAGWSQIPDPPKRRSGLLSSIEYLHRMLGSLVSIKPQKSKEDKFLEKIGGQWGERYSLSLVSPSVVPNYFPTMRVVEYNITGLDLQSMGDDIVTHHLEDLSRADWEKDEFPVSESVKIDQKKSRKRWEDYKRSREYSLKIPKPPSKSAPPGPAYSPQTLSLLGYTQYFANLTRINNDFVNGDQGDIVEDQRWHHGKHSGKKPKESSKKHHKQFKYEVEYDTRDDSIYGLRDLTVRSFIDLAGRIGQYKPPKEDRIDQAFHHDDSPDKDDFAESIGCSDQELSTEEKKGKKHGKKHKHRKAINKIWFTFVNRAYVGTRDEQELHDEFGQP